MGSLSGKVCLVTGGSRGIGKAAALALAEAGADIILTSRKAPDLEIVADEIRKLGRKAAVIPAHVGRIEEINALVEKAVSEFGKIDVLLNNAGTSPAIAGVLEVEERLWDSIMNVNLKGLFFLSQAVAKKMKEAGSGSIINVASLDGFKPEVNNCTYAVTKAGVIMVTKSMALELAQHKIRVNAVAPGNVHTKLGDSRWAENAYGQKYLEHMLQRTPMGRIAEPSEIAGAVVFLASDAASFVTGETILIDGGMSLT